MIAILSPRDAHHAASMRAVEPFRLADAEFLLSTVSLAELLTDRRRDRIEAVRGFVGQLGAHAVVPVGEEIADRAGELRSRRKSMRLPDALIAATADLRDAEVLLTTDRVLARHERARLVSAARG